MAFQFGFADDDDDLGSAVDVDSAGRNFTQSISSDILAPAQEISLQDLVGKRCHLHS